MKRVVKIFLSIIFSVCVLNVLLCPGLKADNLWQNLVRNCKENVVLSQGVHAVSLKPSDVSLLIEKLIKMPSEQSGGLSVKFSQLRRARHYIMNVPAEIKISEDSREIFMGNLVGNTFSVAMGIALFIPLNLCLYAAYQRRLTFRNACLYRQMTGYEDIGSELCSAQEELLGNRCFSLSGDGLMKYLEELMKNEALYTNPVLTCRDVAARLGMTESDVRCAVCSEDGFSSFENYVDLLRLNCARNLMQYSIYTPLTTIAACAGFLSYKKFHMLFLKEYGISPNVFYKVARIN